MSLPVIIIGAGGHAAVVADALLASGARVLGFTDRDPASHGSSRCGLPVLGDDTVLGRHTPQTVALANGIGGVGARAGDALRREVHRALAGRGWRFVGMRHPSAIVSPFARLGGAVQLHAGSIVQPDAEVGEGCIVNTGAVIEHDAQIGAWCHVAPGALVCGNVSIGARCHIGAGAIVRQGIRLADDTVVGAGAVVVEDCPTGCVLVGVPARRMERSA